MIYNALVSWIFHLAIGIALHITLMSDGPLRPSGSVIFLTVIICAMLYIVVGNKLLRSQESLAKEMLSVSLISFIAILVLCIRFAAPFSTDSTQLTLFVYMLNNYYLLWLDTPFGSITFPQLLSYSFLSLFPSALFWLGLKLKKK